MPIRPPRCLLFFALAALLLLGCLSALASASQSARAADTPAQLADECLHNAFDYGGPYFLDPDPKKVKGARALDFQAYLHLVQTNLAQNGPSCDQFGSRTVVLWEVMADNHGKRHRNSPVLTLIKNSNAAMEYTWFRLPLWKPYTCRPGRGTRYWGVTFRVTAKYGGRTKVEQSALAGDGVFGWGLPC